MSQGFRVWNSSGFLAFDDNNSRFTIYAVGSIAINQSSASGILRQRIATMSIPANVAQHAVVFMRPPLGTYAAAVVGSNSIEFRSDSRDSASNITVPYIIATSMEISPLPTNPWGLRLFRGDGSLAFDSSLAYMETLQYINGINILENYTFNETFPYVFPYWQFSVSGASRHSQGAYVLASVHRMAYYMYGEEQHMGPLFGWQNDTTLRVNLFPYKQYFMMTGDSLLPFAVGRMPFIIGRPVYA